MAERIVKIAIESTAETAPIERTTGALKDVEQQSTSTAAATGDAAGSSDQLSDALADAGNAAKSTSDEITDVAQAADDLASEAAAGADNTGDLASSLGEAAASGAVLGLALSAATASLSLAIRVTREYVEALKAEASAIKEQQTLNHAGAIDMTRNAISKLNDEYDKLATKRHADHAAVKGQIAVDKEYELAVNERAMQQAITAAPDKEKQIRKAYGARARGIRADSERDAIEADLDLSAAEQTAAEAKAAEMAETAERLKAKQDEAVRHKQELEQDRDEKVEQAGKRTPILSWKRLLMGGTYTDLWHDAPANREKRAKKAFAEYQPLIEDEDENIKKATAATKAAQDERDQAIAEAAAAKAAHDRLMVQAGASSIKRESNQIEQQRVESRPIDPAVTAEIQSELSKADEAYAAAGKLESSAQHSAGRAGEALSSMAAESKAKGDQIIQTLTAKFGDIVEKIANIEAAQQDESKATSQAIAQLTQQWSDIAASVASLPSP